MIESIFSFLKELISYLILRREDKKVEEQERKEELNEIEDIANNGSLDDLFKYINDKKNK